MVHDDAHPTPTSGRVATSPDASSQANVAQLVSQSSQYLDIYDEVIAAGTPKFIDRVLSVIGLRSQANANRLARIKDYAQDIAGHKARATQTLVEAIHLAEHWRDQAQRLHQSAMGNTMRQQPRLEVLRKQLASLESSCQETIAFVRAHSQVSDPPQAYIQWTEQGRRLLANRSMAERAAIEEEWRMVVEAHNEVRKVARQLEEAERLRESSALLESTYEASLQVLREERGRIHDRFDLLSVYINAQQLVEIEHFFDAEVRGKQLSYFANAIKGLEKHSQAASTSTIIPPDDDA